MGNLGNSEDPGEMRLMSYFIWVCTVCGDKINLQRKKCNIFFRNHNLSSLILTMDHLEFIACSFMEKSIDLNRVNKNILVKSSNRPCVFLPL